MRSWRSSRDSPAILSSDAPRPSATCEAMSAGPRTGTWRRMVASREISSEESYFVPDDSSASTLKSTLPNATREPGVASASMTRTPFR